METLEWWPDYGGLPLWLSRGRRVTRVSPSSLGLEEDLGRRLMAWSGEYDEDKLPLEGSGDREWLFTGRSLLKEVRLALAGEFDIVVTEPWWDESAGGPSP